MIHSASLKEIIDKIVQVHRHIDYSVEHNELEMADKLRRHMAPLLADFEYHLSSPVNDWKTTPVIAEVLDFFANLENHVSSNLKSKPIIGNVLELAQVGRKGSVDLKDSMDVSIGVSNSLLLLANALAIDFNTINFEGYKNDNGKEIKSRFRESFETARISGDKLIADQRGLGILIEIDNPEVWKVFIEAIIKRVDDAFSSEDDFINKILNDKTVELNQPFDTPTAGVDNFTQEIVKNMLGHIPEERTNHLDPQILSDLIMDLAKSSVASLLIQSLNVPDVDKDNNLVVNGEVLPDNTQVNVAKMQMATYMGYGVNRRYTKAKRNLEEWIKLKGIKKENLKFPWIDGKGKTGLDEMIGEVSKNYFVGLCKTNWALSDHLDPAKLENVCPTKIDPTEASRWEEYIDRFKNLGTRPIGEDNMPIDEPKVMRQFRDQKVFYEGNKSKAKAMKNPVPYRAYKKVYKIAMRIVESQFFAVKTEKYTESLMDVLSKKKGKDKTGANEHKLSKLKDNISINNQIVDDSENIEDAKGE